jgi:cytidylate kinase
METYNLNVEEFLDSHTKTLSNEMGTARRTAKMDIPVITVSMQPGSGGHAIAKRLAERLELTYVDKEILKPMAICNNVNSKGLEIAEKYRTKGIGDFLFSMFSTKHVHHSQYLSYLKEYVSILGQIGNSVVVGRGVNFILPKEKRFAIRVTAPLETRIKNVAYAFNVSYDEAKKRIANRAAKRREFVRNNFHADIEDPLHYDLTVNTNRLDIDSTVETIIGTIIGAQVNHAFEKSESYILRKQQ